MTIYEIAQLAKVSPATVSRVFSNHPNLSSEIRERVLAIAKIHHYHPRVSAKQRNVVILLPGDEIYPIRNCLEMVMMALSFVLPKRGFRIEVLPMDNLDRLDSIQFCGAVAIGAEPADFRDWDQKFAAPLVLIDRERPGHAPNLFSVRSDEMQGMALAIDHLYERNCRKIGCIIHGMPGSGNADLRHAGIVKALTAHQLPAAENLIYFCDHDNYVEIIGKLLKQNIDALFCPGGNAGIVTAYALSLFNRQIPNDISLIASEQKIFSKYSTPPQTTITQDHIRLAEITADIIDTYPAPIHPPQTVLPYSLHRRDSVREANNGSPNQQFTV